MHTYSRQIHLEVIRESTNRQLLRAYRDSIKQIKELKEMEKAGQKYYLGDHVFLLLTRAQHEHPDYIVELKKRGYNIDKIKL